jgi:putative addiction module component (TIGR02574 family)
MDMKPINLTDVLALPIAERLKLVEAIWDSIAEVPEAIAVTPAQQAELDRRLDEYLRDPTSGSPWPEVKARILNRA